MSQSPIGASRYSITLEATETKMTTRAFCYTLNNYTPEELANCQAIDCRYHVIGKEVGESQTPHLQAYIHFNNPIRATALKKKIPRAHIEVAKGSPKQASDYCKKSDKEPWEHGELPQEKGAAGGQANKRRYDEAYESAKRNKLDDIPKDLLVRHYGAFKSIAKDNMEELPCVDTLDHEWYTGPSGTGKSRKAYEQYPGAYRKMCNKWWDGYKGEEVVIIDDLDKKHDVMAHHLKIWGDHYPFIAESKGGAKMIRPKKIIITSNYTPLDIWGFDEQSRAPIERRYKIKNFPQKEEEPTLSFP